MRPSAAAQRSRARPSSAAGGRPRRRPARGEVSNRRLAIGRLLLASLLVVAGLKLVTVQTVQARQLSAEADKQRITRVALPAERGAVLDRARVPMAFSVAARALVANPFLISRDRGPQALARKIEIALGIAQLTGLDANQLYAALNTDKHYVVLAPLVEPPVARAVRERFPEIAEEVRESRQYPGGPLAANVIGVASWDVDQRRLTGLVGLEASRESTLAGIPGRRVVDTAEGADTVIPGSARAEQDPVPGSDLQLTLDSDLQYTVQRQLSDYVASRGARGGSAVVLDALTGEVRALANSATFDPRNLGAATEQSLGNPAVTSPFEPGSVNKVVTMAAALEAGLSDPMAVRDVPDRLSVADRVVHDAWNHPTQRFTLTGILARSSNVGTLLVARDVGPDRFADMMTRMGLGSRTGVGLPGESPGTVPERAEWSGSTFGNLPIGQGLSMTVLQLAGMYQAIANDGVRVPPRIVAATIGPDGVRRAEPRSDPVRAMSVRTARTLREMLTAVTQPGKGDQRGTGPEAAVEGYRVAGKTGTAQQVNAACQCYSESRYWINFAGIFPAEQPRYVVAIVLDAPSHGQNAAAWFHDIASALAQRERIPVGIEPSPPVTLVVH